MKGSYFTEAIKETEGRRFGLVGVAMFALMAIGFVVVGAWCLKISIAHTLKNRAATVWPTATGKITQSTVQIEEQGTPDFRTMYRPEVVARFQVNGKWYGCQEIFYGYGSTSSCGTAWRAVSPYPPGGTATVHYNPENPSESVLEPGFKGTNVLFLAVGSVFLFLGLIISIPLFFSRPAKPEEMPTPIKAAW